MNGHRTYDSGQGENSTWKGCENTTQSFGEKPERERGGIILRCTRTDRRTQQATAFGASRF